MDGRECWVIPDYREDRADERYKPLTMAEVNANRKALLDDPTIRELMPLTVAGWLGTADVPWDNEGFVRFCERLRDEEIAYGVHLLKMGSDHTGMFHRRCTAAAIQEKK